MKHGTLWTYPETTTKGLDSLVEYTFGPKAVHHGFCATCGVAIRARLRATRTNMTLNVRTMNGLDLATLKIEKMDGKSWLPVYEI
jgi:hypothetical protein